MENLENYTYKELDILLKNEIDEYNDVERSCVREKLPWHDACDRMRPIATKIFEIEQEMRLKCEPELIYRDEWKGSIITLENFITMAKNGQIDDSSNRAYYSAGKIRSNIRIYAADVLNNKTRSDFSHVILL